MTRRVILLHNETAGEGSDARAVRRAVEAAGAEVVRIVSTDEDWRAALRAPREAVVAAGGDGTVRRAAEALAGGEIPLAILPMGTANNVARSLGIGRDDLAAALAVSRPGRIDLAEASGPWGRRMIVESAGMGALADAARASSEAESKPRGEAKIPHARARLREALARAAPRPSLADLAGGEAPLFVELCLMPLSGPRLPLALAADPSDGLLDVVVGREADREAWIAWLDDPEAGSPPGPPPERRTGVTLARSPGGLRLDGDFTSDDAAGSDPGPISITVLPRALGVLRPTRAREVRGVARSARSIPSMA